MFKTILSIALAIGCALVFTRWIDQAETERQTLKPLHAGSLHQQEIIPHKEPVIKHNKTLTSNQRSLETIYAIRAYLGAPPVIPHPQMTTNSNTFKDCLACHKDGGWVGKLNAWAPVTPHPNYIHCQQCHVYKDTGEVFKDIDWASTQKPKLGRSALGGSPPFIPHTLQLRENCNSCHSGPSAPAKIRTGHPERLHCRQCHLPTPKASWERKTSSK